MEQWILRGNEIKDSNGQDVCFMAPNPMYVLNAEEMQQAKLICHAPDMLAMLKTAKADIYEVINGRKDASHIWHEITNLINQIEG